MPIELIKCNRAVRIHKHVERLWTCTLIGMFFDMFTCFTPLIQLVFMSYQREAKEPGIPLSSVKAFSSW